MLSVKQVYASQELFQPFNAQWLACIFESPFHHDSEAPQKWCGLKRMTAGQSFWLLQHVSISFFYFQMCCAQHTVLLKCVSISAYLCLSPCWVLAKNTYRTESLIWEKQVLLSLQLVCIWCIDCRRHVIAISPLPIYWSTTTASDMLGVRILCYITTMNFCSAHSVSFLQNSLGSSSNANTVPGNWDEQHLTKKLHWMICQRKTQERGDNGLFQGTLMQWVFFPETELYVPSYDCDERVA